MLYALPSPNVDEKDQLDILENQFGLKDLNFVKEHEGEFMSAAQQLIDATREEDRKEYEGQISAHKDEVTAYKGQVAVLVDTLVNNVIHNMLDAGNPSPPRSRPRTCPRSSG